MANPELTFPVSAQLDTLAQAQKELDSLRQVQDEKRQSILAPVQEQLTALEAQFAPQIQTLTEGITRLEAKIKADVIALSESVEGMHLHAVYAKGRVSWDDGKLLGYAAAGHPEIKAFRSEGQPSVSMRKIALKEAK
ncbi:MAG: hypothetical protein WC551_11525 [Patescibacteria group bacterium]